MQVILINGAPFSGKDTLAQRLCQHFDHSVPMRIKNVLYRRFSLKYDMSFEDVVTLCNDISLKDKAHDKLNGLSPRQALISISEDDIKPRYGDVGVARMSIEDLLEVEEHGRKLFVYSDGGFEYEKNFMQSALRRFGLTDFIVVRIVRDGCSFEAVNDSREYISNPDIIIDNNVDETHLPEEERGAYMLEQFLAKYKNL